MIVLVHALRLSASSELQFLYERWYIKKYFYKTKAIHLILQLTNATLQSYYSSKRANKNLLYVYKWNKTETDPDKIEVMSSVVQGVCVSMYFYVKKTNSCEAWQGLHKYNH